MRKFKSLVVGLALAVGVSGCGAKEPNIFKYSSIEKVQSSSDNVEKKILGNCKNKQFGVLVGAYIIDNVQRKAFVEVYKNNKLQNTVKVNLPDIDMVSNEITDCIIDKNNIYFVERVDTYFATSLNQSLVYICKLDKNHEKYQCKQLNDYYTMYPDRFFIKNSELVVDGVYYDKKDESGISGYDAKKFTKSIKLF